MNSEPDARVARAAHDELVGRVQTQNGRRVAAQDVRAVPVAVGARVEHSDRAVAAREIQAPARRVRRVRHELREVDAATIALAAGGGRGARRLMMLEVREADLLAPPLATFEARRATLHERAGAMGWGRKCTLSLGIRGTEHPGGFSCPGGTIKM